LKAVKAEQKLTDCIVKEYSISGIISDNRFGVRHTKIPSVYITHQLRVLSGVFTWFTSKIHQKLIKSYDECWIPDTNVENNLSGNLSQVNIKSIKIKYLGITSRLTKIESEKLYDILVILSGPEPQRSLLEQKIIEAFKNYKGSILLVRGKISNSKPKHLNHIKIINYMTTHELDKAISSSDLIIARSGYSTLLDLATLNKKAFFIPTPGQKEQEYLARRLDFLKIAPYCSQNQFHLEHLKRIDAYKGFEGFNTDPGDYSKLLSLFQSK